MKWIYGRQDWKTLERGLENCYLLTNGLGGFSSLTMTGAVARNDHSVFMACTKAPNHRVNMVHRIKEELGIGESKYVLSTQEFADGTKEEGYRYLTEFSFEILPSWRYLINGIEIEKEIVMAQGSNQIALNYHLKNRGQEEAVLCVTPFFQFEPKGEDLKEDKIFSRQAQKITDGKYDLFFETNGKVEGFQEKKETYFYRYDECDGRRENGTASAVYQIKKRVKPGEETDLTVIYSLESRIGMDTKKLFDKMKEEQIHHQEKLIKTSGLKNKLAQTLVCSADKFLSKRFKTMPKSLMYKYIRTKYIKLNGKKCDIKDMLKEGDVLTLYIKDEFFEESEQENYEFLKAPDKLDIVYEDENIILIDKKPGIIVHQDKSYHFDSLVARVQHYLYNKGEYNPKEEKAFAPALANRIDRNTGGIVIAAKNADSLRVLNAKIKTRELEKYYLCLLHGKPKKDCDILHDYLIKNEAQNKVKVFSKQVDGSKEIITKYEILDFNGKYSLAEVELLTGRTHQIRAHMAYIGHPLVGDTKYGKNRKAPDNIKYQALYSYKLKFSFDTDAGILNYLNGKEFSVKEVWFAKNKHISI